MINSQNNKTKFSVRFGPYLYKFLLTLITATCRVKIHGNEHIAPLKEKGKPFIYSIWHNNVPISPWALRNQDVTVMVSESKDGEIIARAVKIFGNTTVRGSTSKGSAKATRQALKTLKKGNPVAITPDGPRGPKYKLQDGVLFLAALSGAPIIPFHCECSRQIEFNSWDKQKIPKPFSTIHLHFGKAIDINRDELNSSTELAQERVELAMMDNVKSALKLVNRDL